MLGIDDINRLEKENEQLKKEAALNAICIANYIKKVTKQDKLIVKIQNEYNNRKPAAPYIKALKEIRDDFMCFRSSIIPFHIGNKGELPHRMADVIQDYCESINNKIDEVLKDV